MRDERCSNPIQDRKQNQDQDQDQEDQVQDQNCSHPPSSPRPYHLSSACLSFLSISQSLNLSVKCLIPYTNAAESEADTDTETDNVY